MSKKNWKTIHKIGIGFIAIVVILCGGFYIYTLDYYKASKEVGLVFYPGGKVEATAYVPLLLQLADEGITCVLVEMPMNLAVFNIDGAEDVISALPDIEDWYLAGHSLGGAMASSYMENNSDLVEGLILLGAYPLNEAEVDTLVLYGTHDILLDRSNMYLADEVNEIVGGNHAQFGDYGIQKGDGTANISREVQQRVAVDYIKKFIFD